MKTVKAKKALKKNRKLAEKAGMVKVPKKAKKMAKKLVVAKAAKRGPGRPKAVAK